MYSRIFKSKLIFAFVFCCMIFFLIILVNNHLRNKIDEQAENLEGQNSDNPVSSNGYYQNIIHRTKDDDYSVTERDDIHENEPKHTKISDMKSKNEISQNFHLSRDIVYTNPEWKRIHGHVGNNSIITNFEGKYYKRWMNITDLLISLQSAFEPTLVKLKNASAILWNKVKLEPYPSLCESDNLPLLSALDIGFSDAMLKADSSISILQMETQIKDIPLMLDFYNVSSNDCHRLSAESIKTYYHGQLYEESDCRENVAEVWETVPFTSKDDDINKIGQYGEGDHGIIWTYIFIIPHALVTYKGLIVTRNFLHRAAGCLRYPEDMIKCSEYMAKHPLQVYDEVFTISQKFGEAVYHFLVEDLPRLVPYVGFLLERPWIKVYAPGYNVTYLSSGSMAVQFLNRLGIESSRLVFGHVQAKLLYLPAGTQCTEPAIFSTQMLSLQLKNNLLGSPRIQDTILIIQRSAKRDRYFRNMDSILQMINGYISEIHTPLQIAVYRDLPDRLSPEEMAEMFNQALIVIAIHGAGLTNMVFSQPGTTFIEVLCYLDFQNREKNRYWNLGYKGLASRLGMRHHLLIPPLGMDECEDITADDIEKPLVQTLKLYGMI